MRRAAAAIGLRTVAAVEKAPCGIVVAAAVQAQVEDCAVQIKGLQISTHRATAAVTPYFD
jgi:hypothetical protein